MTENPTKYAFELPDFSAEDAQAIASVLDRHGVPYELNEAPSPIEVSSAPREPLTGFLVHWTIDNQDAETPRQAALAAWTGAFDRSEDPGPDEACVFVVTDLATGEEHSIDLSEPSDEDAVAEHHG